MILIFLMQWSSLGRSWGKRSKGEGVYGKFFLNLNLKSIFGFDLGF